MDLGLPCLIGFPPGNFTGSIGKNPLDREVNKWKTSIIPDARQKPRFNKPLKIQ
jgi:hypothetical protein